MGITGRNINIEDIESVLDTENLASCSEYSSYNDVLSYNNWTRNPYPVPYIVSQERTGVTIDGNFMSGTLGRSEQSSLIAEGAYEASETLEVTSNYWEFTSVTDSINLPFKSTNTRFSNDIYKSLLLSNGEYVITSRLIAQDQYNYSISVGDTYSAYAVIRHSTSDGSGNSKSYYCIESLPFTSTTGGTYGHNLYIRPIVEMPISMIDTSADYQTDGWPLR